MALREELVREGNWLFRWRSYLPLILLVPLLAAMQYMHWPLQSQALHEYWETVCFVVSLVGLGVRIATIGYVPSGTSEGSTRHLAAESLNTTGFYSVVRHPLYLGNFLIWLGIALFCLVWWLAIIYVLAFWLYYERIMFAEEEFLRQKYGEEFQAWAAKTPPFVPRFSQWTAPSIPFSMRKVLRREYTGFFGIVAAFFALEIVEHLIMEDKVVIEPQWAILGSIGLITYVTLRTLKKRTQLLTVA